MKLPLFIRRIIALVKVFRHKEYGGLLASGQHYSGNEMTSHIAKATKGDESMECLTPNRSICRACGQDGIWCSVYTSCPLNRGNEHSMKRVCLRLKRHGRVIQMTHCFVYDGPGDGRHCVYCADVEVLQENPNQGS